MGGTDDRYHALFLCTGNSARSIMAEAILNRLGVGRIRGHSAGSHPKDQPHPVALETLRERGYDTSGLRSKSWNEFADAGAPRLDFVFTVCDNAAGEACPVWPGRPVTAHWGIEDPADFQGPELEQRSRFQHVCGELERRIDLFTQLEFETLEPPILRARLEEIGSRNRNAKERA